MENGEYQRADCIIVGGGPAGLTAAIYLARFRRRVILIDDNRSRARYIKASYNYPGFQNGINGNQLIDNLRVQATQYGALLKSGFVTDIQVIDGDYVAVTDQARYRAPKAILATGSVDEKPFLPSLDKIIYDGGIRFCPICDGFEALDRRIGVMGPMHYVVPKSCFLSTYTRTLYLFPTDRTGVTESERERLAECGLDPPPARMTGLENCGSHVIVTMENGDKVELDVLYPALGTNPRSGLAIRIGAEHNKFECLMADSHQQTSLPGLYIAGDLTTDLSQIAVATGQAAIAATHIHNSMQANPRSA